MPETPRRTRNWTNLLAWLLVATTAVLLAFGALVTTYEAAMAVPDWPATYGQNLFLFPLADWLFGPWDLFLEHGHRLLGATVGILSLALAAVVWGGGAAPAVRTLAVAAVLLVVGQGALGGARVLLDDRTVAKVHACTGPLFFAVAVALAALTRNRRAAAAGPAAGAWLAAGLSVASYLQLVAGAQLRHLDVAVAPETFRGLVQVHLAGAVVVAALAALVAARCGAARSGARLVAALVVCQWALGLGTWLVTLGLPTGIVPEAWRPTVPLAARSGWGAAVVTAHAVLGMLIFGVSVAVAIGCGALEQVPRFGRRADPASQRGFA